MSKNLKVSLFFFKLKNLKFKLKPMKKWRDDNGQDLLDLNLKIRQINE